MCKKYFFFWLNSFLESYRIFFRKNDPKEEGKRIEFEFIDIYPTFLIIKVKFRISNKGEGGG